MTPQYLTPSELCRRFRGRVSEATIANWRSQGKGPTYTKIGGRVLYELGDVQEWEKSQRRSASGG